MSTFSDDYIFVSRRVTIQEEYPVTRSSSAFTTFPVAPPGLDKKPEDIAALYPEVQDSYGGLIRRFKPYKPVKDLKEIRPPGVCVWQHLSKDHVKQLELCFYSREAVFEIFENIFSNEPNGLPKQILFELQYEVLRFCRVNTFSHQKISATFSIFYKTHKFFCSTLWRTAEDTYNYFKETILRHTVLRPPRSAEILEPQECRSTLIHFCKIYLRHLPLIHVTSLPKYSLELLWEPEYVPLKDDNLEQAQSSKGGKVQGKKSTKK